MKRAYAGATLSHFVPKIEKTSILAKSHRPNLVWTFSGQGLRCCIHYWKKERTRFLQVWTSLDKFLQAWTSLDQFGTKTGLVRGEVHTTIPRPNPTRFFGFNPILDPKFGLSWVGLALRVEKRVQPGSNSGSTL